MSNPTAEWEKIGDRFYRKIQLYTSVFDEDLELDNYHVAGAQYGGAIGLYGCAYSSYTLLKLFKSSISRRGKAIRISRYIRYQNEH